MADEEFEGRSQYSRRVINGQSIDISHWATPDEGAMQGERRTLYFARKQAIYLYLSGTSEEAIKRVTSLGAKHAYRLIRERCLETHSDGRPYGWRGIVPWLRLKPYRRRIKVHIDRFGSGGAGALQALLDCHPDLQQAFEARIRTSYSGKRLVEARHSHKRHCDWLINQLRDLGYEARGEWPFNTSSRGYYSVRRHIETVLAANPRALASVTGGPDLVAKLKTGDGSNRPVLKFMQRVEMDAHKLDGRFCVSLPLADGDFQEKIVHRLWVIVILEVVSRAVLGYFFSMRREVSSDDVVRAIKRALCRWSLRPISFCDTPYLPEAGLLSSRGEHFVGLCWDETSVDGALAETCQRVRSVLHDAVGSTLLEPRSAFSKRHSKDDRPFIESFFRNLAGKGFQRLSNTTGAKPRDRKGKAPEDVALASRFQYEYAEELLDVLIANYNATPHRGIGNRRPLAYAEFLYRNSQAPFRQADPARVESLFSIRKRCVVRGGAATGRAPFVEFFYARYTNEILHNRHDLVGSEIWVVCHKENDCRVAMASTMNGMSLGILRAAPPWNVSPHNLTVRTAISQAYSRGQFSLPAGGDAIETFMNFVESQPHRKLPVHPAYLEARRILSEAAEQSIGERMLNDAMTKSRGTASPHGTKPITKINSSGKNTPGGGAQLTSGSNNTVHSSRRVLYDRSHAEAAIRQIAD
ncbi:hypothetical protein [Burkholderia sp. L27(2015)]|uniref:hypothetical protein n=1 Tax=Burkholderia sp. L27(2015) TaxID=1641858 RepID=UPI0020B147FC|nr:hypothetical protein [Burkholderia sp. L27(2015)]